MFNPFAQLAAKEKAEDALPRREGPRVKRADCQASELKAVHSYNLQDSGKSEVGGMGGLAPLTVLFAGVQETVHDSQVGAEPAQGELGDLRPPLQLGPHGALQDIVWTLLYCFAP